NSCEGTNGAVSIVVQENETFHIAINGSEVEDFGVGQLNVGFTPGAALPGDINNDGVVNVADVTMLATMVRDGAPPDVATGDFNGDETVNEADVQALAEIIVGQAPPI